MPKRISDYLTADILLRYEESCDVHEGSGRGRGLPLLLDNVVPSPHAEYARLWLRWDNEQGSVLH